ncbi:hypothetical protein [Bdellovibrio bacteriovorus]|uniref:Class III signal peptide-containing protein n=1 Tax=Bdellovibrio bacteriovorus TaxID=959 RepID=A0A150WFL1_BDEBC|nr:hypothetical protein [Bdellovibrio bacteriovorus]KYG61760.1 hypothetical protein AZI85_05925 [Bdellovibrio bacteriovorus]
MNKRGQIVVEYVLLLTIAVGLSALLVKQLASRNSDEPGVLVSKWHNILNVVAQDVPDKRKQ